MSPLARRLVRRCWPGPVVLLFSEGLEQGLAGRLPVPVRRQVCPAGILGLRIPAHPALRHTMQLLPGPLVLTEAAVNAEVIVETLGEEVAVVVHDGPCQDGRSATVVQVDKQFWRVVREGVVSTETLQKQMACLILFVCTGNTCRSPLAEGLCKRKLADRLGCAVEELPQRGFVILSAGLAAREGEGAAPEAMEAARSYNVDLGSHLSRSLTPELACQADYLIAMTRGHLLGLSDYFPCLGTRPRLLAPDGSDLADPIGCNARVYQQCAEQIGHYLDSLLAEVSERPGQGV